MIGIVQEPGITHDRYAISLITPHLAIVNANSGHWQGACTIVSPFGPLNFCYCITQKTIII